MRKIMKKRYFLAFLFTAICLTASAFIRSDLSLEELDAYYSDYRSNEWEYLVETQEGKPIEVIDHGTLQFTEEIKDSGYYIVYSWGSGNSLLEELDIRGH